MHYNLFAIYTISIQKKKNHFLLGIFITSSFGRDTVLCFMFTIYSIVKIEPI